MWSCYIGYYVMLNGALLHDRDDFEEGKTTFPQQHIPQKHLHPKRTQAICF